LEVKKEVSVKWERKQQKHRRNPKWMEMMVAMMMMWQEKEEDEEGSGRSLCIRRPKK